MTTSVVDTNENESTTSRNVSIPHGVVRVRKRAIRIKRSRSSRRGPKTIKLYMECKRRRDTRECRAFALDGTKLSRREGHREWRVESTLIKYPMHDGSIEELVESIERYADRSP